jgi:hypothetical protein
MTVAAPDLFAANPSNASTMYGALRSPMSDKQRLVRAHVEQLWQIYHYYAEPLFLSEFPLQFHERWFEMYLGVCLLKGGAPLQKTLPPGPDLLVNANGRRVWIEAVCASGGQPGLPDTVEEPVRPGPGEVSAGGYVPWDRIALRIRNSIEEKKRKYDRYLERGIVTTDDLLLIALNVYKIPFASADVERYVFRSLFGIGNQVIMFDRATAQPVGTTHQQLLAIAKVATGAEVGTQPFIDGSMPTIAGVIVSSHEAVAAAHENSADLTLYPNLTATVPWKFGGLSLEREWTFEASAEGWIGTLHLRQPVPFHKGHRVMPG